MIEKNFPKKLYEQIIKDNGSLIITKEYLKIDNSKELHTPESDIGYLTELDYT